MIHLETISPKMHEIAQSIYTALDSSYYLAGGTALAILSGHRESVDLDYFIPQHIDTQKLKTTLGAMFPGISFTYEDIDTLWCEVEGVKVSFITRLAPCIDMIHDEDGFRIVGSRDIVVMKLNAICGRDEYKDYYDLAILSAMTDVREWIVWWKGVYPKSDPISWVTALSQGNTSEVVALKGQALKNRDEIIGILEKVTKEVVSFL